MSDPLGPYPLSPRATYRLLHFSHRGDNLMRLLLGWELKPLPAYMRLVNSVTGRRCMVPTDPAQEELAIGIIEQMKAEEDAMKNG